MNKKYAIKRLRENREKCSHVASDGSSNKTKLSGMIETLERGYGEERISRVYSPGTDLMKGAKLALQLRKEGFKNVEGFTYPEL